MLKIIATLGAIQLITVVVNVLRSKLLAVLLGPAGVGVISVIDQSVLLVAQLSALSLPFAAVKFLSRSHSEDLKTFQKTYVSLLRTLLTLTTTGALIALAIVFWWPALLGEELMPYRALLVPALLGVPAIILHSFLVNVLAATRRSTTSGVLLLSISVLLMLAAIIGVTIGSLTGFYWANLVANYSVVVVAIVYFREELGLPLSVAGHSIRQEIRANPAIVFFTLLLFSASYAQSISFFVARYAVFNNYGESTTGLLQAAIALAASINMLLNPANGLYLTPYLNRDIPVRDKLAIALEFQRKLMAVMAVIAMPMVLFAPWLLMLLYSPKFTEVSSVLFLFIIAQCLMQLSGVYQALIIGLDDLKTYGVVVAGGHLLLGIVAWALAPHYGLWGVAVAFVISSLALFCLTLGQLRLKHGFHLPIRLWVLMAYSLLALFVTGLSANQFDPFNYTAVLSKIGFYGLFVASLLLFLTHEEFKQGIHLVNKFMLQVNWQKWKGARAP
jgi:O-antigen/teichoic acid export membrane protein